MSTFEVLTEVMKERKSVRKYQSDVVMPQEDLQEILALAASAPSSWNLQHWRYLVITSVEKKEKLLPIANYQKQVVDASVTVVILGDLEANKMVEAVNGPALEKGFLTQEVYDILNGQIQGAYDNNPRVARDEAILNAGFSAMQLMLAAKAKGYDTCPMGGFKQDQLIEEFKIPERYLPVMMITIGKPASPAYPTGRLPLDQLVIQESF
ncbi:nitroreductase family protein [Hazenella coriacea]|uniref:Nitroreductase n=1 Tax=Hazenella coriacea TaxID=1179467 RepID=A0A4R3L8J0_9BACL|nr:nitroreductase family protein [Hazenella coriacea]TCS95892.1 nitroreductase [Hazenella coriacea]